MPVVIFGTYLAVVLYGTWLNDALLVSKTGGSIGKRILGLRVVRATDGGKVSLGQASARWASTTLACLIPFVGGLYALLDSLWLLWDDKRQCLHDKAAATVVVK